MRIIPLCPSSVLPCSTVREPLRNAKINRIGKESKLSEILAKINIKPITQTKGYNVYVADTAGTGQMLAKALLTSCKKPIGFDIGNDQYSIVNDFSESAVEATNSTKTCVVQVAASDSVIVFHVEKWRKDDMQVNRKGAKNLNWWLPKMPLKHSTDSTAPSLPMSIISKLKQKAPLRRYLSQLKRPTVKPPIAPMTIPSYLPPAFLDLLTRPALYKLGVNAHHDALIIYRTWGFRMGGVIDLAFLCDQDLGLKALSSKFDYDMGKKRVSGGWESDELPLNKIIYAARDAIAGLEIHRRLIQGRHSIE